MTDGVAESIIYRPHTSEDLAFLLDSWGRSAFKASPAFSRLSPEEFHRFHRPMRERFFQKPNAAVIVCCPGDNPWQILGWIAVEKIEAGLIVQYVYVKKTFKRKGIAKELLKRAAHTSPVFYTHISHAAAKIIGAKQSYFHNWHYIPQLT